MLIIKCRVKKVFRENGILSDLSEFGLVPVDEDYLVLEFKTLVNANIFSHNVPLFIPGIQNLNLKVEQSGCAPHSNKLTGLLIVQFSINIDLHGGSHFRLNSDPGIIGHQRGMCSQQEEKNELVHDGTFT